VQSLTKAALAASDKDEKHLGASRGDFVEIDSSKALPQVMIDGPYGAPAEDVFNVEVAVLVGAGIGVTPFASILKHIWYRQKRGNVGSLKRVEFFWVCRDAPSFGWFQSLLQEVEAAQADRKSIPYTSFFFKTILIMFYSQLPAHQHLPHPKDRRGHALEHRRQ
jgi:NADPH oxidase